MIANPIGPQRCGSLRLCDMQDNYPTYPYLLANRPLAIEKYVTFVICDEFNIIRKIKYFPHHYATDSSFARGYVFFNNLK